MDLVALHSDLDGLLPDLGVCLRKIVEFDGIGLVLPRPGTDAADRYTVMLASPEAPPSATHVDVVTLPSLAGTDLATLLARHDVVVLHDLDDHCGYPELVAGLRAHGKRSACLIPLTTALRPVGIIGFASAQIGAYDHADLAFLGTRGRPRRRGDRQRAASPAGDGVPAHARGRPRSLAHPPRDQQRGCHHPRSHVAAERGRPEPPADDRARLHRSRAARSRRQATRPARRRASPARRTRPGDRVNRSGRHTVCGSAGGAHGDRGRRRPEGVASRRAPHSSGSAEHQADVLRAAGDATSNAGRHDAGTPLARNRSAATNSHVPRRRPRRLPSRSKTRSRSERSPRSRTASPRRTSISKARSAGHSTSRRSSARARRCSGCSPRHGAWRPPTQPCCSSARRAPARNSSLAPFTR